MFFNVCLWTSFAVMQNMKQVEICFDFIRNGKVFSNGMEGMGNQDSDRQVWERVVGSLSW